MSAIYSGAFWNSAQPRAREPFRSYTASITQRQFVPSLAFGRLGSSKFAVSLRLKRKDEWRDWDERDGRSCREGM
jgi:hypothetical protein